jgi:hypothetical protein
MYCLQNDVSIAMVKASRTKQGKNPKKNTFQRPGRDSDASGGLAHLISINRRQSRALNVSTMYRVVTNIKDPKHYTTVVYNTIDVYKGL